MTEPAAASASDTPAASAGTPQGTAASSAPGSAAASTPVVGSAAAATPAAASAVVASAAAATPAAASAVVASAAAATPVAGSAAATTSTAGTPLARHGGDDIDVPHRPGDRGSAEPKRRKRRDKPLVIVVTGHGKGKSTSAFGMLLRSWARGYRCGVFQFVKSGKWKVGEAKAAVALGGIDWEKMGDGWSWLSRDLDESAELAREGWAEVKRAIADERYEFLLLDEITYPIKWGWIDVDDVVATLRERPGFQHVVITGRDAAPELVDLADLVSEVRKVKHPMDAGIRAQQGIEW